MKFFILGSIFVLINLSFVAVANNSVVSFVDTKIGVIGTRASNCVIGPQLPFGAVCPSPNSMLSDGKSTMITTAGYNPNLPVMGFSQLHVSGTGGASRYGHFLISPQLNINVEFNGHSSEVVNEATKAYYYKTRLLRYGVITEISPAKHSAMYRFTFPKSDVASIVLDAAQSISKDIMGRSSRYSNQKTYIYENSVSVDKENDIIKAFIKIKGGWGNSKPYGLYFVAKLNKKSDVAGVWKDTVLYNDETEVRRDTDDILEEQRIGSFHKFKTDEGEQVLMKIALSFKGYDKAMEYLETEMPHWNFERVKDEAKRQWENYLGRIRISEDVPEVRKKLFYTAMYHSMVMPRDLTGDNPLWNSEKPFWNDHYCVWDTWRTVFPLHCLINPEIVRDNIAAFIDRFKHNGMVRDGFISLFDVPFDQGGNNIDNIIVDAYLKGIEGVDWDEAYELLKYNAEYERGIYVPNKEKKVSDYVKKGWVAAHEGSCSSKTLEFAYNDFCVASMAKGLGKMDDYEKYIKRSENWKNLWNDTLVNRGYRGFIGVKDSLGRWVENYPDKFSTPIWTGPFYEGISWNYSFYVPHDVDGMMEKMGGKELFVERLDSAFRNKLIDFSNEPAFLTPFLFCHADRPDLAAYWAKFMLNNNYDLTGGLGNDDSGAMSSWYIFASIGIFPNAGQNFYYLLPPSYPETRISLPNGKCLSIVVKGDCKNYVKACRFNGKVVNNSIIMHKTLMEGGTLEFELSDEPTDWGTHR